MHVRICFRVLICTIHVLTVMFSGAGGDDGTVAIAIGVTISILVTALLVSFSIFSIHHFAQGKEH